MNLSLSNQWMEFYETYTAYVWLYVVIHSKFCQDVSVIEEFLPFDCLNVDELFRSQP